MIAHMKTDVSHTTLASLILTSSIGSSYIEAIEYLKSVVFSKGVSTYDVVTDSESSRTSKWLMWQTSS